MGWVSQLGLIWLIGMVTQLRGKWGEKEGLGRRVNLDSRFLVGMSLWWLVEM